MSEVIFPRQRAIEDAVANPGLTPLRLFSVVWPLWQVETIAAVYDEQAYEVIDGYLVRVIREAELRRPAEMAAFLGLNRELVDRCLAFLAGVGHVEISAGGVALTELGEKSAQQGIRLVRKETRQRLLMDKIGGELFPRTHYQNVDMVLDTPDVPDESGYLPTFTPLAGPVVFRPDVVIDAVRRTDRAELNIPGRLLNLRIEEARDGFIPVYLVETAERRMLVYSPATGGRDAFLEAAVVRKPLIWELVDSEPSPEDGAAWRVWLDKHLPGAELVQRPDGLWRAVLPGTAFGPRERMKVHQAGSYRFDRTYFIQIWTEDAEVRMAAVKQRILQMASGREFTTRSAAAARVLALAETLEVAAPTLSEIRAYGVEAGMDYRVARLDALIAE